MYTRENIYVHSIHCIHQILAHLKTCANTRKYVLRENVYVYSKL